MAMAMACAPEEVRDMPPSEPRARARRPSLSSLAPPLLLSHHEQEEERGEGRDAYSVQQMLEQLCAVDERAS